MYSGVFKGSVFFGFSSNINVEVFDVIVEYYELIFQIFATSSS